MHTLNHAQSVYTMANCEYSCVCVITDNTKCICFSICTHTAADGDFRVQHTTDKLREMLNSEAEQESSVFNEKHVGYEVRKIPLVNRNITELRFSVAVQRQQYQHICVFHVQMEKEMFESSTTNRAAFVSAAEFEHIAHTEAYR